MSSIIHKNPVTKDAKLYDVQALLFFTAFFSDLPTTFVLNSPIARFELFLYPLAKR
jgi:hypothetical protein